MKIYIEATNPKHAPPSQWAGSYTRGPFSALRKLWQLWHCPYRYRSFLLEINEPKKKQNVVPNTLDII